MFRFHHQQVAAVLLTLALAGPPLWWAGEALNEARQMAEVRFALGSAPSSLAGMPPAAGPRR